MIQATKTEQPAPSKLEEIKEASLQLRGGIAAELSQDSDHFEEAEKQLLKFHGSYQQEDRDARKSRRKEGLGKYYMFMVRCKIPGGTVTAEQYLALDKLADEHANHTLRITTRQGIQFHGILKTNLKASIAAINDCLLTTLGACGDVNRNVMVDPTPKAGIRAQLHELGDRLAERFAPKSGAYHEIWLNGENVTPTNGNNGGLKPVFGRVFQPDNGVWYSSFSEPEVEPIYGKYYLPRKFKIGIGLPENNLVDIHSQDLGMLGIVENGKLIGYNVLAGGGMGRTQGKPHTFPFVSKPIAFVPVAEAEQAAEAVIRIFRDNGNRSDRKQARLKYVLNRWGLDKFREVFREYMGKPTELPKPVEVKGFDLSLGWNAQGDGKYWYGISVENGRIKDEGEFQLKTALVKLIGKLKPTIRLTPQQDLLLCDLKKSAKAEIEKVLKAHGVSLPTELPMVQQYSMACPAIPTCGLAISESERSLPELVREMDTALKKLGMENEPISIRQTGCPNGCARPYQSDIGLVGRSGIKYALFVGGTNLGNRLNYMLQDLVPQNEIVPTLVPILKEFKKQRKNGESFGDFCHRLGREAVHALIPEKLRKPLPDVEFPEFARTTC